MLPKFNQAKHQQHLAKLPKLPQAVEDIQTLYAPAEFRLALLKAIKNAAQRIYITALYLENDDAGREILNALYDVKTQRPNLDICILVDWHRAQRGRIGETAASTNADWYCQMAQQHPGVVIPVYGVPVNTREALGVLHLKGFIIDNCVIYSGVSLNNIYLHRHDKYRYDRYQLIKNERLADTMSSFIQYKLITASAIQRLDHCHRPTNLEISHDTRQFRYNLRNCSYDVQAIASNNELAVTPIVGLGKQNLLNKTIHHLIRYTDQKLTLCTPYFNPPKILVRDIIYLLRQGRQVEIIVGDKSANDFFIPENEPFRIIGALPYLYEINLRRFLYRLQRFIDNGQLTVRIWTEGKNSYHLKGMWIDNEWSLITGNNLNPRAWRLDLENAILIHDPHHQLADQRQKELDTIRIHTKIITSYLELETLQTYPVKVRKLIRRLSRIRVDRLISRIL